MIIFYITKLQSKGNIILSHLNHSPIEFYFLKNSKNFIVEEIPLYSFSGAGEHLILKIRKKDISTFELLNILSKKLNIKKSDIGYAGLKDKDALSIQYVSINKKLTKNIESLQLDNIKILDSTYHNNKIKIGHLKGNKFYIRIKKLNKINANKIQNVINHILNTGMPNYFGFQRFGNNGNNYNDGKAILQNQLKIKDKKISKFLISAYQSYLFNTWLQKRIEISHIINNFDISYSSSLLKIDSNVIKKIKSQKHFFKLLNGDIMQHFPYGKYFFNDDSVDNSMRFYNKQIVPTGLLYGIKSILAKDIAGDIENNFIDNLLVNELGSRRLAWIFLDHLEFTYKEEIANGEFNFSLPKGSYATILLNLIANREINKEVIDEF